MEIQKENGGAFITITGRFTFGLTDKQYSDIRLQKCPPSIGMGDKWLMSYHAMKRYIEPSEAQQLTELGCTII